MALAKVLSLNDMQDDYNKVICSIFENNSDVVILGNEVSSWYRVFLWSISIELVLLSKTKAMGEH